MKCFFSILMVLMACSCTRSENSIKKDVEKEPKVQETEIENWQNHFDFDGDQIIDSIFYQSTGGANCCYELSVRLSKFRKVVGIPFLVDGGYLFFNLSQKENFDIVDQNKDGIFEIFINVGHLEKDFETEALKTLRAKHGFETNKIIIDLQDGKIKVVDFN